METTTVETTGEGVTGETPTETSPVSEEGKEVPQAEGGEEQLPFGKHPRWQKMLGQNKELSSNVQTLKSQLEELNTKYSSLSSFDSTLRDIASKDPSRFQNIISLLKGETKQDPYEGFDPLVAEKFRKLDEFENWRAQIDQVRAQANQQTIDAHFNSLLEKSGFIKDGKAVDNEVVGVIEDAVLESLKRSTGGRLETATPEQVDQITGNVIKAINAVKRLALKETIKQPNIPASGSRPSTPVSNQPIDTEEERHALIASILAGGAR